jgi:hypothetical protein
LLISSIAVSEEIERQERELSPMFHRALYYAVPIPVAAIFIVACMMAGWHLGGN